MPTIYIQPRDLHILQSLSVGRYLTAEAIAWLHFPAWRRRYRASFESGQEGNGYSKPGSAVYDRLRALRREGLIGSFARSIDTARQRFARLPDACFLTQAGAELLAAMGDVELHSLWWESGRKRSLQNVEHSVAIGMLYAALRCALEHHGKELQGWQGDHLHRDPRSYDRVLVPGLREPLPVQPDATFVLDGQRYFVEVDRNSRPIESWHEKALAYHAYRDSAALRTRYAIDDFVLLTVAPTKQRLERIAEEIAKVKHGAEPRALLLLSRQVHPTRIRGNWQQMAAVETEMRRVVNRLVPHYTPRLHAVNLWEAPN